MQEVKKNNIARGPENKRVVTKNGNKMVCLVYTVDGT